MPSKGNLWIQTSEYEPLEIMWLVNKVVTTSYFPIGFLARYNAFNVSVHTSWDYNETIKVSLSEEPRIHWFQTPMTPEGVGNVSFFVDDLLLVVHNISWTLPPVPVEESIRVNLVHDLFSFWVGATRLNATFYANGLVVITHTLLDHGYGYQYQDYYPGFFPYSRPFSLRINISNIEWREIVNYLEENSSHRWQSWTYYNPIAYCDGGGYKTTLIVTWNPTTQTTISKMRDDDSCSGQRIFTIPTANFFLKFLLDTTMDLISQYLELFSTSSVTLEPSATKMTDSVSKMTYEPSVTETTEHISRITLGSGFISLLAVLVLIPVIKRFQTFSKK